MNNLKLSLLLATVLIFFVSCEKKQDEIREDPVEIYGKWEPIKGEVLTYEGNVLINTSTEEIEWYMIQFNEDGYCIVYYDIDDPEDTDVMRWTRSGDVVIIDDEQFNLESLSKDELVFSYWEDVTEQYVYTCSRIP